MKEELLTYISILLIFIVKIFLTLYIIKISYNFPIMRRKLIEKKDKLNTISLSIASWFFLPTLFLITEFLFIGYPRLLNIQINISIFNLIFIIILPALIAFFSYLGYKANIKNIEYIINNKNYEYAFLNPKLQWKKQDFYGKINNYINKILIIILIILGITSLNALIIILIIREDLRAQILFNLLIPTIALIFYLFGKWRKRKKEKWK